MTQVPTQRATGPGHPIRRFITSDAPHTIFIYLLRKWFIENEPTAPAEHRHTPRGFFLTPVHRARPPPYWAPPHKMSQKAYRMASRMYPILTHNSQGACAHIRNTLYYTPYFTRARAHLHLPPPSCRPPLLASYGFTVPYLLTKLPLCARPAQAGIHVARGDSEGARQYNLYHRLVPPVEVAEDLLEQRDPLSLSDVARRDA